MDWLRSEDLKEEKNVTAPITIIAAHCALSLPAVQGLPLTMIGIRLACPDSDSLDDWEAADVLMRQEPDEEEDEEEDEGNRKEDDDGDENKDGYQSRNCLARP
jgi:hypothetical protein